MPATKGKKRNSEAAADHYESDGGFIANDSDSAPKAKKTKTAASTKAPVKSKGGQNNEDEEFWEITTNRRISITQYSGKHMINIREYYEDKNGGGLLPGKKGIALPIAQYSTLLTLLPDIEAALTAKGETVPRPDFTTLKDSTAKDTDQQDDKDSKGKKENRKSASTKKKNFEATSDEDEEAEEAE
ncbi:MAG: hypothetical protein L6R37_006081 [Teloschistes peruensis]|nr:MAG: hypothetical protein L6R37_006081 [Teloschistes peruensis]